MINTLGKKTSYCGVYFFQRKQKEVQKENEFYVNLIQQALPTELQNQYIEKQKGNYLDIFCLCKITSNS